jgi:hypothetical protein
MFLRHVTQCQVLQRQVSGGWHSSAAQSRHNDEIEEVGVQRLQTLESPKSLTSDSEDVEIVYG